MFEVRVCAIAEAPLRTSAGLGLVTEHDLSMVETADIVVMPTWHEDCRDAPPDLIEALRRAHARGACVMGLCLGAFPLAQAGLLEGRSASTHWAYAEKLSQRYPGIKVDRDVLYVDEGTVLTSAGVAAGLDCCLHLLRRLCGAEFANRVARRLVLAPHRQGGQAQFIERPLPISGSDSRFSEALEWVSHHLELAHSTDALAERAVMSRRNFTRRFRQATGTSFKQWLLHQRLAHAQHLLETTTASSEVVAQQAGFGSALSLRQHFRSAFRTSPMAYRKLFHSNAQAPVTA